MASRLDLDCSLATRLLDRQVCVESGWSRHPGEKLASGLNGSASGLIGSGSGSDADSGSDSGLSRSVATLSGCAKHSAGMMDTGPVWFARVSSCSRP